MKFDLPFEFYVTAVDPGLTTGLALLQVTEDSVNVIAQKTPVYSPEFGLTPVDTIMQWGNKWGGRGVPHFLVLENFHVRPLRDREVVDTTPLRVIGGLEDRLIGEKPFYEVVKQEPLTAKRKNQDDHMVTDAVLKRLGLTATGPNARHVRDAFRHAVTFLMGRGHLFVCETAYPRSSAA